MKSGALFLVFLGLIAFSSAQVYLFDSTLLNGLTLVTNAPSRIGCSVASSGGVDGGPSISVQALTAVNAGDNCYLKFTNSTPDLTIYNEIEFFIKASPINADHGYAGLFLEDSASKTAGPNIAIPTTYTRFRFPLKNTFTGIDFTHVLSPFYLNLFFVQGERLTIDNIVLHNRNNFEVFTDSTQFGRETIVTWGGSACSVVTRESAPEGTQVLLVPANTWGCGLFFSTPSVDLSAFSTVEFLLRSPVPTLIELESASGKHGVNLPSTNNNWTPVTLTLSQFGLNLSQTNGPFLITKVGDNTQDVQVDRIRYFA